MVAPVRFVGILIAALAVTSGAVAAERLAHPPNLPRYDLDLKVDTGSGLVSFRMDCTWTNRADKPTDRVLVNFYPNYKIPPGDYLLLAKTLELLRLNPRYGIDKKGQHGTISKVAVHRVGAAAVDPKPIPFSYRNDNPTALVVPLPGEVKPGESVSFEIVGSIQLKQLQGRWGQWNGITFLTNALPTIAYYDADGWHDTPFVPWHQPFWNEAGIYTTRLAVPKDQVVACSAVVDSTADADAGWKSVKYKPFVGRDFAVTCSADYREYKSTTKLPDGREVAIKCYAFPKHEFYANAILQITGDAIAKFSNWLGPYPYDQFTIAESYFGWNGNECSGLIMIDERIFAMPHSLKGYADYLVSHETCHQWWYNQVGTNGYSETFMDEGAATYFTHRLMNATYGKNNEFLDWPKEIAWLPNIKRENYRFASYYGALGRNEGQPAAADLPSFGHLFGLFTGAYDRGSKAFELIEARLGEAAFLDFTRGLVKKYSFDVISAKQFKAELEAYTGQSWTEFFDKWIYGKDLTDWKVESVKTTAATAPVVAASGASAPPTPAGTRVEVIVRQAGALNEPTTVGFQLPGEDGFPIRIPVGSSATTIKQAAYEAEVEPLGDGRSRVTVTLPAEPEQVAVDPDRILLDANPGDNQWKTKPRFELVPFYSMLNETDLTNDYDRWNFGAGPWIGGAFYSEPWYTRSTVVGARAGAYRTQFFSGGIYGGYRTDYRDLVIGADGLFDHVPGPRTQIGFNVEQRVGGPYGDVSGSSTATRGVVFGRYIFQYGSSLYLPPMHFADIYSTYQDNFLPFARETSPGAVRPAWTWLNGFRYRLNLLTPYWDPEHGVWFDAQYGGGVANLGKNEGTHQGRIELAGVHSLPEGNGYWSAVKFAGRLNLMGAFPDEGQFFALGGGTLFRGFDLAERQGSFLWATNAEVRLPLVRDVEWDAADRMIGVRNLNLALFTDIGEVYANGRSVNGVAYALGAGLRVDLAVFSFLERATVRLDFAKTVNAATPFQFWFGVQNPF